MFRSTYFLLLSCIIMLTSCGTQKLPTAPAHFEVEFVTSKGNFVVAVDRQYSPLAADRFYQLVISNYFSEALFYRMYPGFVAQFGTTNKKVFDQWEKIKVPDEPVILGNTKGTLAFARGGKNSRGTDLFINLGDNTRLDTLNYNDVIGFPVFGKVTSGLEVLESLEGKYKDDVMKKLDLMYQSRKAFLKEFPGLDNILSAKIIR